MELEPSDSEKIPISLTYHNLNYKVNLPNEKFFTCAKGPEKQILHNVSGHFDIGIHAIMGPTGCGKTTILDSLCGRKDPTGLTGTILIGKTKQPKNFKQICGYVAQDDVIMPTLSVKENLRFSIDCRTNHSEAEKEKIIEETLRHLSLEGVQDNPVGDAENRGVSGGERKRTAIGMELVVKPQIIFLDEPTTGLDATTALQVISILGKLAKETDRVIIMSIHQPRYSIYKLFDSITLMALGRTAFHGTPNEAFNFFQKHNYTCPKHFNPADHFLDVINGDSSAVAHSAGQKHTRATSVSANEKMVNKNLAFEGDSDVEDSEETGQQMTVAEDFSRKFLADDLFKISYEKVQKQVNSASGTGQKMKISKAMQTSMLNQFKVLAVRNLRNLKRNPTGLMANVMVNIIFALVIGIIFLQVTDTGIEACQNRMGVLFFLAVNIMFSSQEVGMLFAKERTLYVRELSSGYYTTFPYYVAKIICDFLPIRTIPAIVNGTIAYWMIGLRAEFVPWLLFVLLVQIESFCASALAAMYAAWINTFALVQIAITLTFVFMLAFAGLLVNIETVVPWLAWIQYLSIPRYALIGFSINEFSSGKVNCTSDVAGSMQEINGMDWIGITLATETTYWQYWTAIIALSCLTFGFFVIGFFLMKRVKTTT